MLTLEQLPDDSSNPSCWQPTYTLYGGADRFSPETPTKMLFLARKWLKEYPWLNEVAKRKVERRLARPLEDFRIDFEDGYGRRGDEEEDAHAQAVALALPQAQDYRRIGLRLKPLTRSWATRSLRTLGLAVAGLSVWPSGFCITLPKLEEADQVHWLLQHLIEFEGQRGPIPIEIMVESPKALRNLESLVGACAGRCRGIHFGPYDFLASCGIGLPQLHSPLNVQARAAILLQWMGRGVELADGPTTTLPLPVHRQPKSEHLQENQKTVRGAWERHRDDVVASRNAGFRQSWLLHPSQLVSHTAALLQEYDSLWPQACERLGRYWKSQGQASSSGSDFDDRATARQWVQVLQDSLSLGFLDEQELFTRLPSTWREV